jgi:hypothetical protein
LFVTARQVVPAVGQSLASSRCTRRGVRVAAADRAAGLGAAHLVADQAGRAVGRRRARLAFALGARRFGAAAVHLIHRPGITQASPFGQPPPAAAAIARGSQLNVQVWYAVRKSGHMTGPSQTLPGPPPPAPNAAQSALPLQKRRHTFTSQPVFA